MLARVVHQALWRAVRVPFRRRPNLEAIRVALARAEALVPRPPPTSAVPTLATVIPLRPPAPPEDIYAHLPAATSPWDPEPVSGVALTVHHRSEIPPPPLPAPRRSLQEEELLLQEINGCKTLLLEIIRRAAYDWVLYRGHTRLTQRVLADQAYRWLFEEKPDTADWAERMREKKYITSFEAICEGLDLDPDTVRKHIRRLTPKNVLSVGRPAEYRRRDVFSNESEEGAYSLPGGMVVEYNDGGDDGTGF